MTTKKTAGLALTLLLPALIAIVLAAPAGAGQPAGRGPACGSPTLDGVRDALYGSPIATDPAGDLANPGPGEWPGTAWTDQTALYCQNDDTFLYVYADLAQYSQSVSSGQIGLVIDLGTPAGGSGDPWGNAITYNHPNRPDYIIRGNIPGINNPPNDNNGWTELRAWSGSNWNTGQGVNWGGIPGGGQVGGKIAYSNANGVEFKIPLSDIGSPALGGAVNVQFFATQAGSSKGAYDTVPSDDQSTGWDVATTLVNYAACPLTTAGPTNTPTATPTSGPSPTPTATPTLTPTPPSSCSGAVAGDGVVVTSGLYHDNTLLAYRDPQAPIQPDGSATLRLRACQDDVQQVQVLVWRTGDPLAAPSFTYSAAVASSDGTHSLWEAVVPGDTVNLWYQFRVTDGATVGQFNPISGNTGPGKWYTGALANPSWSLPVVLPTPTPPPDFAVPSWIHDAVIYQIFPDRFRNGNPANDPADGTLVYEPAPDGCAGYPHDRPNPGVGGCQWDRRAWTDPLLIPSWGLDFHGGDLQGIIDKINAGYFNDLGVNTLYLNPIFESSSNHGYDTNDYFTVRAIFGDNTLFDQLISAADAKGLRVILDGVFNHAGMDSVYIDKNKSLGGACASASSPQRAWFTAGSAGAVFGCADGWGWKGWYNYATLPEFVDASPGVRDLFFRGGAAGAPAGKSVSQFWQERGIAGWRYDVAQDITHDFFQNMRPYVKGTNASGTVYGDSEQLMLGEVTGGCDWYLYQSYINQNELDSVMNYCFRDWAASFGNGNAPSQFDNLYNQFRALFPPSAWKGFMNLISTHDSPRMLNYLSGDKSKLKLVTLLQFTLPGAPSVYYGDEVGMGGGSDPDNRRTFPWPDINGGNNGQGDSYDAAMYAHFKKLLGIRNAHGALRSGDVQTLLVDDANGLYSYLRSDASDKLVIVLNNKTGSATATIPLAGVLPDGAVLTDLLNTGGRGAANVYIVSGGQIETPVDGRWGRILLVTSSPLAVNLAAFDAQGGPDRITVRWETVSETGNAGFNLYRSASAAGPLTLLAYVPSQAPGSTQGFAYSYEDLAVQPGETWWYTLEDVSLSGATSLHGPVSGTVQAPTAVTLASVSASPATTVGSALPWLLMVAGAGLALTAARRRR